MRGVTRAGSVVLELAITAEVEVAVTVEVATLRRWTPTYTLNWDWLLLFLLYCVMSLHLLL